MALVTARMRTRPIATALLITPIMAVYLLFFKPRHVRTEYSPDKQYRLEIYMVPKLFAMPGDGSTYCARFRLYKGYWRVPDDMGDCEAFTNSLEIRWDYSNCIVWVSRGHGIDLYEEDCRKRN